MMLGRVDEVDGHYIATKFVALLVPTGTMYVTGERASRAGQPIATRSTGVPVRFSWRSAALGYGRVHLPLFAVAWPFVSHLGKDLGHVPASMWIASVVLLAASLLFHLPGRLPEVEKARLRILGSVTGMRIDPSKLQPATREVKRDSLADLMDKGGLPTAPEDILAVIDDIPGPAYPLVYAYACYVGDDEVWQACAKQLLDRCKANEI